ncbi:MAG: coenzyme F420-0:L-glutamate ligase [Candidatus Thorarchaeota archaeon]
MNEEQILIIPIHNFPFVSPGDDIPFLIDSTIEQSNETLKKGDIVVVTHSVISIAEGRLYRIDDIVVSKKAMEIAAKTGHEPKRIEVALQEAKEVLRESPILITKTHHGIITDFSGIDESNAPPDCFIALPTNPNETAKRISEFLTQSVGFKVPVIITDTQGRPWRKGAVNLAIGVAGMSPFIHNAGKEDIYGHELQGSLVCLADQIASSAELIMGQSDEGIPVVIVRGVKYEEEDGTTFSILRSSQENLFR